MDQIGCPKCGSKELRHCTDAFVVRKPAINSLGALELHESHTDEFDHNFFECFDCGYQPREEELLANPGGATNQEL